ncbi:MAG: hypothetical protein QG570_606, partial [Patescibacteria group bacterium]|nr:hypothetical protein [Patescibacteria group bacterium]
MTKQEILNIFEKLGFRIVKNDYLGELVEMEAYDAFILSSIAGSPYLIDENGVTMKGRSEVFIHRSVFQKEYFIYSPGLFSRDLTGKLKEGNSADALGIKYPSVFIGKKYIYIHDILNETSSNIEREIYETISKNTNPAEYLLFKNFQSGSSAEPFYEYLTSVFFIKKGYIVENQVPWFQQSFKYKEVTLNGGIPDFAAFHSTISKYLRQYGVIDKQNGIALNLLPVLRNFKLKRVSSVQQISDTKYELIIGEVKSDKGSLPAAINQLSKYKEVELANELYTIIPNINDNNVKSIGEIFVHNGHLEMNRATENLVV